MKKTFDDNPARIMRVAYIFVSVLMVGVWLLVGGWKLNAIMNFIVLGCILIPLGIIMWLVAGFTPHNRVTCDRNGLEVTVGAQFRKPSTLRFNWPDVSDTQICITIVGAGQYRSEYVHLNVVVRGASIELLRKNKLASGSFDEFINIVNDSTPHLPLLWMRCNKLEKQPGSQQASEKVAGYCKIPRNARAFATEGVPLS